MNNINKQIEEIISYLSNTYAYKFKCVYMDRRDLYNDLFVLYLSKKEQKHSLNEWFIILKNFLIDKQRRIINERKAINRLRKEENTY